MMTSLNLLTGLSTGRFDSLKVKNPTTGEYEDVVPGDYASQGDLLQVGVAGVWYDDAKRLSFANAQSYFDTASSTLQIGAPLYQDYVRIGTSTVSSDLTRGAAGELLWNNGALASEALVATKQEALAHYSETSGAVQTVVQSFDSASIHTPWLGTGIITNVAGSHQELTYPGSIYLNPGGYTPGEMVYMSLELKAGTSTSMAFGVRNDTHWTDGITFRGLSSTEWRTFTWSFAIPSTGRITLITGVNVAAGDPSSNVIWVQGTVLLRNFHLYRSADLSTIGAPLTCQKDLECDQSMLCKHLYADHGVSAEQVHIGGTSLVRGSNGQLLWNNGALASEALVATKQDALAHYTETSGAETVFAQSFDTNQFVSIHMFWTGPGSYTNYSGSHQELTLPALWLGYYSAAGGTKVYLSVDLRAGTLQDLVFASHIGTAWFDTIKFQGLSSLEFRNYTWQFTVPANSTQFVMAVGIVPSNLGVDMSSTNQPSGTVDIRNLRLYTTADESVFSAHTTFQKDVTFENTVEAQNAYITRITAGQYFSTSDLRLKHDVQDASLEACQRIFDAVAPKVYERTDLPGKRIGFIAQDVQGSLPEEFANLVGTRPGKDGEELLTIDYSRIASTILWGVVKLQQAQIADLTSRIEALEANNLP